MHSEFEKNYFALFGLPVRYSIDLPDLQIRYRELQKKFHPDKFASGSDAERRLASQMAAQINAGYQTLKSPLARGRYLLQLAGLGLDDEKDTQMTPAFLMEQMEMRENLDAAREDENTLALLQGMIKTVEAATNSRVSQLSDLFEESDDQEKLLVARNCLREMQFLEKFRKDIEQAEDEYL